MLFFALYNGVFEASHKKGVLESEQILSLVFLPTSNFDWIKTLLRRHLQKIFSRIKRIQLFEHFWREFILTRENMRLTVQMQAEIESIRTRFDLSSLQVWRPLSEGMKRRGGFLAKDEDTANATIAELNPYKIRLENMLCETDIKEQARSPMNLRIVIFYFFKAESA